jgi:hypothetical protein
MPSPLDYLVETKDLTAEQRRLVLHDNVTALTELRPRRA